VGRLIRYLRIVSDAAAISLVTEQDGRWVRLDLFGGYRAVPRQRYEYGFAYPADVLPLDAWPFAALPIGFIQLRGTRRCQPICRGVRVPLIFRREIQRLFRYREGSLVEATDSDPPIGGTARSDGGSRAQQVGKSTDDPSRPGSHHAPLTGRQSAPPADRFGPGPQRSYFSAQAQR
jgi:hypothetical protein